MSDHLANPPETDGTQGRWVLIARNLGSGYGLFATEADAWDFAIKHDLAKRRNDRTWFDTLPLQRSDNG